MKFFKFEAKRILSNKKNKILFLIILIFTATLIFFSVNLNHSNNLKSMENTLNENLISTEQSYNSSKNEKDIPQDFLKSLEKLISYYEEQKKALESENLVDYNKVQIKINDAILEQDATNNYAKEQNRYINNVIDKGLNFEYSPQAQLHSFGIINEILFPILFSSLFFIVILLIGGISLSSDIENNIMKFYKTPAYHNKNLIITTFFTSTLSVTLLYLSSIIFYLLGVGLFNGLGSLTYPSGIERLPLIENWKIDSIYALWGILVMMFIVSLGILLSLVLRKSLLVIGIFSIIILGYDMMKNQPFMDLFIKFIPMSYFNPIYILQNEEIFSKQGLFIGTIYLLALIIIFLVSSKMIYKKINFRKI